MKVTIIIPNYNHEKYLEKRFESIFKQTFTDYEVIFLDDCSTDGSLKIYQNFSKVFEMKAILNEKNSGSPFVQWNKGLSISSGEFIWIAESDDFADPRFLEIMVDALENSPGAALAFCQSNYVDSSNDMIGKFTYGQFPNRSRWGGDFKTDGKMEVRKYFSIANPIPNASAVVFRADLAHAISPVCESLKLAGDWLFWIQLLISADLIYISQPLNNFRQAHEQSQRSRSAKDGLEMLEGLDIYEYIEREIGLSKKEKQRALNVRIRHWMFLNWIHHFDQDLNRQIFKRLVKLGSGVYSESSFFVKLNILLRVFFHTITQQPFIRKILKPIWQFFKR